MSKRQRSAPEPHQRVVIDAGGTKHSTTVATIERSSYLYGMIDASSWESDPGHVAEIFLDRDPEIFSQLLRLMRQCVLPDRVDTARDSVRPVCLPALLQPHWRTLEPGVPRRTPHVAGLLPTDPRACASVIAEADFFGFDPLLCHVKTVAYYNSREAKQDHPGFDINCLTHLPNETLEEFTTKRDQGCAAHDKACKAIDDLFAARDSAYAQTAFDKTYGSIGDALSSGVLPSFFLNVKPPLLKPFAKILQLMPVDQTTWLLVGDIEDRQAHPNPDVGEDYAIMVPVATVFTHPALVRRVACYALVENEVGKRWVEAMIHITTADQQEWMSDQPWDGHGLSLGATVSGSLPDYTENVGQRTVLASEWVKNYVTANPEWNVHPRDVWSHVLIADIPPNQHGFRKAGMPA